MRQQGIRKSPASTTGMIGIGGRKATIGSEPLEKEKGKEKGTMDGILRAKAKEKGKTMETRTNLPAREKEKARHKTNRFPASAIIAPHQLGAGAHACNIDYRLARAC